MSTVKITDRVDLATLAAVYRRVHAGDLHLTDHSDPSPEDRLRWTAEAPGFQAAVGYANGEVVGAVVGCPLPPETLWWRDLGDADPALVKEWRGRTFALCEAFLLPGARRSDLGVRMIVELLAARTEERTTMAVADTNTRVWHALESRHFEHVGDVVPFPGWRPHRMLVRSLPLRHDRAERAS
ncbi:N-acetyltransferase [Actinoplanes sp. NPDC051470]|uniref:N-acetyltransferase n=1 Tax=Actinoplanes sp. NPDC051470 TaxID=3157224 RepID=UPI00341A4897